MGVVLCHNWNNRRSGLDSQMESTLLKAQQLRFIRIAPRSLGEDKDTLSMNAHFLRRTIKGLQGRLAVRPVNEYSARERHEPAQERNMREGLLSSDAAVRREDTSEHKHVEFGLMVSDEHCRPSG